LEKAVKRPHEKLKVWQLSVALVSRLYTLTGKFPDAETLRIDLADQKIGSQHSSEHCRRRGRVRMPNIFDLENFQRIAQRA